LVEAGIEISALQLYIKRFLWPQTEFSNTNIMLHQYIGTASRKLLCRVMDIEGTPEIKLNFGWSITCTKILPKLLMNAHHLFSLGQKMGCYL
jgi:hypothetical protein